MQMEIISDRKVPTRENNTLDITLARQSTSNRNITQEVLHKLNRDHNPTQTAISLQAVPYRITHSNYIYTRDITEYTVMDYAKTKTNIGLAFGILDRDIITVEQISQILKSAIAVKKIQQRPIKFWTPQLKTALKLQNKARKRIGKARKRHIDPTGPFLEYKIAQKNFRKFCMLLHNR